MPSEIPAATRFSGIELPRPTSERYRDWRTLDPMSLGGQGEELQIYREKIEETRAEDAGQGQYVLIVGSDIIRYFATLDEAVSYAQQAFKDRRILIKQVVALEPIHSLGGAMVPLRGESV